MRFSVITPTFNRREVVRRAIASGLQFVRTAGDGEVVVIDDASRDGTADMLRSQYAAELSGGLMKLVARQANGGSTVAKSDGARNASGDWLVFLDSDDELLPQAAAVIPEFIDAHAGTKLFLFRCVDENDRLIGPPRAAGPLSFAELVNNGTPGECLPVASRAAFLEFPSDKDVLAYEFMSLLRIVRTHGDAMLSESTARRYHTDGNDRLTSRMGNLRRARKHAEGFAAMLREFGPAMSPQKRRQIRLRILCYRMLAACGLSRI